MLVAAILGIGLAIAETAVMVGVPSWATMLTKPSWRENFISTQAPGTRYAVSFFLYYHFFACLSPIVLVAFLTLVIASTG